MFAATEIPRRCRQKKFEVNELVFVPLTLTISLKPVDKESPSNSVKLSSYKHAATGKESNVFLLSSGGLKIAKEASIATGVGALKEAPNNLVVPYWVITETEKAKAVNVKTTVLTEKVLGKDARIPCFTNHKKINAGDAIKVLKADDSSGASAITAASKVAPKHQGVIKSAPAPKRTKK